MRVVNSFAASSAKAKKGDGRHINAGKRLKADLKEPETHTESKGNRKNSSREGAPSNIILVELDPAFPSKFDSEVKDDTRTTKIFYNDEKGFTMAYPTDNDYVRYVTQPLSDLKVITDQKKDNKFNVIVGHPKKKRDEKTLDEKTFVVLKVSATVARVNQETLEANQLILEKLLETMPTVKRGGMRTGVESKYICSGWRKNPLDRELGEYTFQAHVGEEEQHEVKRGVIDLVKTIESRSLCELKRSRLQGHGRDAFAHVQKKFNLPSINEDGVATQLALAKGYCSPVHVDNDFYYSSLSCIDATAEMNQTLYHFCFPSYGIAIPMRSGDIILFNPLVPHCATNPRVETALIYSLYVSNKTCNTRVANNMVDEG